MRARHAFSLLALAALVGCGGGSTETTTTTTSTTPAPATAAPATVAPATAAPAADMTAASGATGDMAMGASGAATTAAPTGTVVPGPAAIAEAETIFSTRCAACHGLEGKGDGLASASLNPKPRNYHDAAWQASVTDADIEKTILMGGAAVGKSSLMVPNPDLATKPEVLAALRMKVRSFAPPGTTHP